jgi:hypothetical protein
VLLRPLLDVFETARLLKVSPRTVYIRAWRQRFGLPAYRIGGVLRFREDDLEHVLNQLREPESDGVTS